jgi:hypothetical protein
VVACCEEKIKFYIKLCLDYREIKPMFVVLSLRMTLNNLKSICIINLMKIPQNFEIFPIICVGCIHEIMSQRCTWNKDLGD